MSRTRILFDRGGKLAEYSDGELVWVRGDAEASQSGPQVIKDIEPYKSMITGETITGRRQHRDHLRAHGCVELGNETSFLRKPEKPIAMRSNKETLHRVLADVSDRQMRQIVQNELRNRR